MKIGVISSFVSAFLLLQKEEIGYFCWSKVGNRISKIGFQNELTKLINAWHIFNKTINWLYQLLRNQYY